MKLSGQTETNLNIFVIVIHFSIIRNRSQISIYQVNEVSPCSNLEHVRLEVFQELRTPRGAGASAGGDGSPDTA